LCGVTLREAGRQAGGMKFSTVSTVVRRLENRAGQDSAPRGMQIKLMKLANDEP